MDAGASTPDALPATHEAAIAAGYTEEQIKAHKESLRLPIFHTIPPFFFPFRALS
jgi:hypothetical protein